MVDERCDIGKRCGRECGPGWQATRADSDMMRTLNRRERSTESCYHCVSSCKFASNFMAEIYVPLRRRIRTERHHQRIRMEDPRKQVTGTGRCDGGAKHLVAIQKSCTISFLSDQFVSIEKREACSP